MYVLNSPLSAKTEHTEQQYLAGAETQHKTPDKDTGEETVTQRAALPDQYTNTNADTVIDEPLLTTEGRKLSTIIG